MKSKFNVDSNKDKRTYDDITFDSVMEMKYYRDVVLPASESGEIFHYELQKSYILQPGFERDGKKVRSIVYKADFYIEYSDGRTVVIDIKGHADSVALLKRKLFWFVFPDIDYRWITLRKGEWILWDEAKKKRSKQENKGEDINAEKEENC